jgi:hypothetical protein
MTTLTTYLPAVVYFGGSLLLCLVVVAVVGGGSYSQRCFVQKNSDRRPN